jgi:hypothetical protein
MKNKDCNKAQLEKKTHCSNSSNYTRVNKEYKEQIAKRKINSSDVHQVG